MRLFVWASITVSAVTGYAYAFGAADRTATATFDVVRDQLPFWGFLFLGNAILLAVVVQIADRKGIVFHLVATGAFWSCWSTFLAYTTLTVPTASLNAWAVYAFVALCHFGAAYEVHEGRGPWT